MKLDLLQLVQTVLYEIGQRVKNVMHEPNKQVGVELKEASDCVYDGCRQAAMPLLRRRAYEKRAKNNLSYIDCIFGEPEPEHC